MTQTATNENVKKAVEKLLASDPYPRTVKERWKNNKGTQLFIFTSLIFLAGSLFLLYRQNRFVPVGFPSGDVIRSASPTSNDKVSRIEQTLLIVVVGATDGGGVSRLAFYDKAEGFNDLEYAVRRATAPINNGESKMLVPVDALARSFAIAVFHDENGNGVLDRNRFGIPTERYGFSNNARGLTGPPSFDDAKIDRPDAGQSIMISIR